MQSIELKMEKQDFRTKEAFKTLRTNIEFYGENIRVICVTSCTPNEGKSTGKILCTEWKENNPH